MKQLFNYQQELVDKTRYSMIHGNKNVLIVSPPGSGKSIIIAEIARLTTKKGNRVLFFVHRKELVNQIIDSFIEQGVDMSLCTIMTVRKVANRLENLPKPNIIIVDESQHSRAKTYLKIFDYYSDVPRIGFTGSPWRLSGKGFDDIYSTMIVGKSVQELIDNKKLAPFTLYGYPLGNTNKLKKSSTGDYTNESMDEFSKSIIHGDIVKSWRKFANNEKTIVYCHSIKFSETVAREFRDNHIKAVSVDSHTPQGERDKIMSDFKSGKIKILCNCDLISEGFNVPDCSCVVLLRPTESLVIYLQQSMRCMRYQPNKQAIIIDQVGNFEKFGLPNQDRKWTIKDRVKNKKTTKGSDGIPIKTCLNCFAVVDAKCKICPICKYRFEVIDKEVEQHKNEELLEVSQKDDFVKVKHNKTKADCHNLKELIEFGIEKGYQRGWAYIIAKQRGYKINRRK